MHDVFKVLLVGCASFFFLYLFSRLLGKKQIAQLNFVDYVIGISFGSIAAEMAFDAGDRPFYHYIIAMSVFFVLALFFGFIGKKGPFLKRILNGKPIVIIYEGTLDYKALKKSGIDVNDLLSLMREQSFFDISQIYYAVFEPSGKLSIMPVGAERPTVSRDLPIAIEEPSLPNYLIIDGVVSYSGLSELNRDISWLLGELKLSSKKELKNIILALYDEKNQKIITHFKKP